MYYLLYSYKTRKKKVLLKVVKKKKYIYSAVFHDNRSLHHQGYKMIHLSFSIYTNSFL